MTCPKCKHEFQAEDVKSEVSDCQGSQPELEIKIWCPGCSVMLYTFIPVKELEAE